MLVGTTTRAAQSSTQHQFRDAHVVGDQIEGWIPIFLFALLFRMWPIAIGATKRRRSGFLSGFPTCLNPARDRSRVALSLPAAA